MELDELEAIVFRSPYGEEGEAVATLLLGGNDSRQQRRNSHRGAPSFGRRIHGVVEVLLGLGSSSSSRFSIGWSVRLRLLVRCLVRIVEDEGAAAGDDGDGTRRSGSARRFEDRGRERDGDEEDDTEAEVEAEALWRDEVLSLLGGICDELRVSSATVLRRRRGRQRLDFGAAANDGRGLNIRPMDWDAGGHSLGRKRRRPQSLRSDGHDLTHRHSFLAEAGNDDGTDTACRDRLDVDDDWMLRNWEDGSSKVLFMRDCSSIVRFFVDDDHRRSSGSVGRGGTGEGRCVNPGGGIDGFGIELADHLGAVISCVDEYVSVLSVLSLSAADVPRHDDRPGGVTTDDGGASSSSLSSSRRWREVLLRPPGRPLLRLREVMGRPHHRTTTAAAAALDVSRCHLAPLPLAPPERGDDDDLDISQGIGPPSLPEECPPSPSDGGSDSLSAQFGDKDGRGRCEDVVRSVLFDRLVDDVDGNFHDYSHDGFGELDGDGDPTSRTTRRMVPLSSLLRSVPTRVVLDYVLPGAVAGAISVFHKRTAVGVEVLPPLPPSFVGNVVTVVNHLCTGRCRGDEVVSKSGASAVVRSTLNAVYRTLSAAAIERVSAGEEGWVGRSGGGGEGSAQPPSVQRRRAAMVVLQVCAGLAAADTARREKDDGGGGAVIPSAAARSDAAVLWLAELLLRGEWEGARPMPQGKDWAWGAGRSQQLPLRSCLRPYFLASACDEGQSVSSERVADLVVGTTTVDIAQRRRCSAAISFLESLEEHIDSLTGESWVGFEEEDDSRPPSSVGGASSTSPRWRERADDLIRLVSDVRGKCCRSEVAVAAAPSPTDRATMHRKRHSYDRAPAVTPSPPPPPRKRHRSDDVERKREGPSTKHHGGGGGGGGGGTTTTLSSEGTDDDGVRGEALRLADAFVEPGGARRAKEWIERMLSGESEGNADGECRAGRDRFRDDEDQTTRGDDAERREAKVETPSNGRMGARDYLSTLLSSLLLLGAEEDEHPAVAFNVGDTPPTRVGHRRTVDPPLLNSASRRGMALLANHLIHRHVDGWEVGRRLLRPSPLPVTYPDEGHFSADVEALGKERLFVGPTGDDLFSFVQPKRFPSACGGVSYLSLDVCLQNFLLRDGSDGSLPDLMACTDDLLCMAVSYGAHGDSDSLRSVLKLARKYSAWLVPEIAIDRYRDMFQCALGMARANNQRGMQAEKKAIVMSSKDKEYPQFDSAKLSRIFYAATKLVMILEEDENNHGVNMWDRVFSNDLCSALLPGAHLAFLSLPVNSKSRISSECEVHVLFSSTVEYICCRVLSRGDRRETNGIRAHKIEGQTPGRMERLRRCWSLGWLVQVYADGRVACHSDDDASKRDWFRTIYEQVWGVCNFASGDKPADFRGVLFTSTKESKGDTSGLDLVGKGVGGNVQTLLLPNFDTYLKYVIHMTFTFDGGSESTSSSGNDAFNFDSWCRHMVHVMFRRYWDAQYDKSERRLMFAWVASLWKYLNARRDDTGWNPVLRRLHRCVSKCKVWKKPTPPSARNTYCFAETLVTWLDEQGGVHDEGILRARKCFLCELICNTHSQGLFPCGMATQPGQVGILAEKVLRISVYLEDMEALRRVFIDLALHVHYCLSNEDVTGIPLALQSDWNPRARCQNLAGIAKFAVSEARERDRLVNGPVWQYFVTSVCTELEGYSARQGLKWWVGVAHDIVSRREEEHEIETLKEPLSSNYMAKLDKNLLATERSTTPTLLNVRPMECGVLLNDDASSTIQRSKEHKGGGSLIGDKNSFDPSRIEKYAAQHISEERRIMQKEKIIKTLWSPNKTLAPTAESMLTNVVERTHVEEDGLCGLADTVSIDCEVPLTGSSKNKGTSKLVGKDVANVCSSINDEDDEDFYDADEDNFCEDENDDLLLLKV